MVLTVDGTQYKLSDLKGGSEIKLTKKSGTIKFDCTANELTYTDKVDVSFYLDVEAASLVSIGKYSSKKNIIGDEFYSKGLKADSANDYFKRHAELLCASVTYTVSDDGTVSIK